MNLAIHDAPARQKSGEPLSPIGQAANRRNAVSKEALSRLPTLDIGELRQQWRGLYKTQAPLTKLRRPQARVAGASCRAPHAGTRSGRPAPRAAAPAAPDCTAVQGELWPIITRRPSRRGGACAGSITRRPSQHGSDFREGGCKGERLSKGRFCSASLSTFDRMGPRVR